MKLSFRFKLLLAMVLLVVGAAGASLVVCRQSVLRAFEKGLQTQFEDQINYFVEKREERLESVKQQSATLAESPKLIAALREGDARTAQQVAREAFMPSPQEIVGGALRRFAGGGPFGGGPGRGGPDAGGGASGEPGRGPRGPLDRLQALNFIRVLDAQGRLVELSDRSPGRFAQGALDRGYRDQMETLGRAVATATNQSVAYLTPEADDQRRQLIEVVVTPVRATNSGALLGALLAGQPLFDPAERTMREMSHILSGIWLGGEFYARDIPPAVLTNLTAALNANATRLGRTNDEFVVLLDGEPHRVLSRLLNPEPVSSAAHQICVYPLKGRVEELRKLRTYILAVSAVILLVGAGFSLWLANQLTVSVRELSAATAEVQRGNFTVQVPIRSADDVGQLVESFNEMTHGLAQKEKLRSVLDLVADRTVAEQLIGGKVELGGEQRQVSVLFCDIRGFTALTQGMAPSEVIELLNEHMTALTRLVHEHGGVVDKFVGDLIMAVFGAPRSTGHDARNAARCALRMIEERARLNAAARHPFGIGIGLATGEVVAGCMGSSDRLNYTVLGARVNLASRLCSQAAAGHVLVDDATRASLGDEFSAEALLPLALKGFDAPVSAWRLGPGARRQNQA